MSSRGKRLEPTNGRSGIQGPPRDERVIQDTVDNLPAFAKRNRDDESKEEEILYVGRRGEHGAKMGRIPFRMPLHRGERLPVHPRSGLIMNPPVTQHLYEVLEAKESEQEYTDSIHWRTSTEFGKIEAEKVLKEYGFEHTDYSIESMIENAILHEIGPLHASFRITFQVSNFLYSFVAPYLINSVCVPEKIPDHHPWIRVYAPTIRNGVKLVTVFPGYIETSMAQDHALFDENNFKSVLRTCMNSMWCLDKHHKDNILQEANEVLGKLGWRPGTYTIEDLGTRGLQTIFRIKSSVPTLMHSTF